MPILLTLANIFTELLEYDPKLIIISRKNFDRKNTKTNFIVIDNLFNKDIANFNSYNANNQEQSLITRFSGDFQISFYGINALSNAILWRNMLMSEKSFTLQSEKGITIFKPTSHNNLKIQDGTNWDELYQADFKVQFDEATVIATNNIEKGVFELYQENGTVTDFETK
jgi:fibronectin type 3 domain-containing protein